MRNIVSILQRNASHLSAKTAYLFLDEELLEKKRISYQELDQQARAIAAFLQEKNLDQQRVLLLFPTGIDFICAFLGCLYAGSIAVPAYCASESDLEKNQMSLKDLAKQCDVSGVLTCSLLQTKAEQLLLRAFSRQLVITDINRIPISYNVRYQVIKIKNENIAYLQHTSGSTGSSKAAVITHKNLTHNLKYTGLAWNYARKSIMLTWTPHAHVFGLICGLLLPIYHKSMAILMSPDAILRQPFLWLSAISKYRVTHSGCPNFGYELCVQRITESELMQLNLTSWKTAINGGENVLEQTMFKFARKFSTVGFNLKHFCSAYGMSELSGTISSTRCFSLPKIINLGLEELKNNKAIRVKKNEPHRKIVASGRLITGLEAIIVDPNSYVKLPKNKIGEVWLAGKSLVSGYWSNEETEQPFLSAVPGVKKLYFRTGDLGFIRNKNLFITGRLKEIIVRYGKKHNPLDIELSVQQALKELQINTPGIVLTQMVHDVEEIFFLQELKTEQIHLQNDVINLIRRVISELHGVNIAEVILLPENTLPKTQSGKIARKLCKDNFYAQKLPGLYQSIVNQNTYQTFISLISKVFNTEAHKIEGNAPLSRLALDSITALHLVTELNKSYHTALTPADLYKYATLDQIFHEVVEKQPSNGGANAFFDHRMSFLGEMASDTKEDIAIIGMSGIFPAGKDINQFWENLINGKNCIREIPKERWDANVTDIKWGGFIDSMAHFDASFFNISPREAELTDPQQRLFLQVVWKTIEDAGYSIESLSKLTTGLFVGVFNHDYAELLQKHNIVDAYITTGVTHSILANRVSYLLNLRGPSTAIDTACSSSLVAIHQAVLAIQNRDCELAIAGGVNALLSPTAFHIAHQAGMLSKEGLCKTFDQQADGYVRSEGAAAILLKPLHKARVDKDHIYGIIKGSAVNHGGHVSSLTVPNPNAQSDVIISAMERAKINVANINYIETHGTGTVVGDPIEVNGLKKAFAHLAERNRIALKKSFCGLGSVKTNVGHLEAAAGIISVIKVLLALKHRQFPGNLHFQQLNSYIELEDSPFYIVDKNQAWERMLDEKGNELPRRAGISSFGFGGTNAHVVIEEDPRLINHIILKTEHPCLIAISAKTETALFNQITQLHEWLSKQVEKPSLVAVSFTLNVGRDHFDKRCVLVVQDIDELQNTLTQITQKQFPENFIINTEPLDKKRMRSSFQTLCTSLIDELNGTAKLSSTEYRTKLHALANFYVEGYRIDWEKLHTGEKRRIALPTYPFDQHYYWIPTGKRVVSLPKVEGAASNLIAQISTLLKIPPEQITMASRFSDLGCDSITFKELSDALANTFKIEITPALFFTYQTVGELRHYLELKLKLEQDQDTILQSPLHPQEWGERVRVRGDFRISPHPNPLPQVGEGIESIAIIGVQAYLPQSTNLEEFWQHLIAGDDLVTEIPEERWDWRQYYGDSKHDATKTNSKWGAFVNGIDQFDAAFFNISAREANLMDPQHRLMLEIVWKTIEDAGYDPFSLAEKNAGLFVGIEFNEYQTLIQSQHKIFHGHIATGNSHAMLANRISYFLGLNGPSEVVNTACSSALVSVHRAVNALRDGECNVAIAGGVSLMLSPDTFVITSQLGALSSDGRCKTFDRSANGYVKGEGVAAILLKPLSKAIQDGDHIYAVIKGTAVNHSGKTQSLTAPNAITQSQLLQKAYTQAQVDPTTITYIETHGTGTELGDPIEIEGLKLAFQKMLGADSVPHTFCGLGSVKSNIGHLEPASGMAGIIKVLLAMKHQKIPGNLHFNEINPYIKLSDTPFYIVTKTQAWPALPDTDNVNLPRRAGISSFGFGGTCAHIVLEEFLSLPIVPKTLPTHFLITLSAKSEQSLKQKIVDLYAWLINNQLLNLLDLSFTLNAGRSHFDMRCAFIVSSVSELIQMLQMLIAGQHPPHYFENTSKKLVTIETVTDDLYLNLLFNEEKLLRIAKLYVLKADIDWHRIYAAIKPKRVVSLPTYPFMKQHYWFDQELPPPDFAQEIVASADNDLTQFTLNYLQKIFAAKLRLTPEQISIDDTYEMFGVDSMLGLEITTRLEQDFGTLSKTLLYEKNNLQTLASYLMQQFTAVLQGLSGGKITDQTKLIATSHTVSQVTQTTNTTQEDIAIIGMSIHFPKATTLDEFWANLQQGVDCIIEIPKDRWNYQDYPIEIGQEKKYFKYGGFIDDADKFDPLFFNISPREASLMDPQERLFLQTAWSTLEDAGYTRETLQRNVNNKVGVFAGVTYNFYPLFIAEEWFKGNRLPLDIQFFSIANRLSYFLNVTGPSLVVDTACSSSLAAIHLACESIHHGECVMALAGGVNLSLHPCKYHMLGSYNFLATQGRCTSFAAQGDGYVPAEGVGAVLLKPLSKALKDEDRIYAVIKSTAMNHGGKTSGYTVPNPNAQAELIKTALNKAQIDPRTISYIEAHGTGTALGDPIEIRGLQDAFAQFTSEKQFCAIGSVKSNLGHLESAAGISQLAKVMLQMQHQKLVPSLHCEELNPYINFAETPFYVQKTLSDWTTLSGVPRRAGVSSFGAGGTNVHVIVEEYIPKRVSGIASVWNNLPYIFLLSALNSIQLKEYAKQQSAFLSQHPATNLHEICYTSQIGRESMTARLAILANSQADLLAKLQNFIKDPTQKEEGVWSNASVSSTAVAEKVITNYVTANDYEKLIDLWINGSKIPWQALYPQQKPAKTYIPTYPFEKRRCWVNNKTPVVAQEQINWLIFNDKQLGFIVADELGLSNCGHCFVGEQFQQFDGHVFYMNPNEEKNYQQLLSWLFAKNKEQLKGIIYLWDVNTQSQNTDYLLHLFNSLNKYVDHPKIIVCVLQDGRTHLPPLDSESYQLLLLTLESPLQLRRDAKLIAHELINVQTSVNRVEANTESVSTLAMEKVTELLIHKFATLLELTVAEIDVNVPFLNYGMDSILGINFVNQLQEHYPAIVSPMDLYRYPSIKQLAEFIVKSSQPNAPTTTTAKNGIYVDEESEFLTATAHLSNAELNQMLEQELAEVEGY